MSKQTQKPGASRPATFGLKHLFFWVVVVTWFLVVFDTLRFAERLKEQDTDFYLFGLFGSIPIAWIPVVNHIWVTPVAKKLAARIQVGGFLFLSFACFWCRVLFSPFSQLANFVDVLAIWFFALALGTAIVWKVIAVVERRRQRR